MSKPNRTELSRRMLLKGFAVVPTTQLYFPGESRNSSDGIFNPDLLVTVQSTGTPMQATFNFVVQV